MLTDVFCAFPRYIQAGPHNPLVYNTVRICVMRDVKSQVKGALVHKQLCSWQISTIKCSWLDHVCIFFTKNQDE